MGVWVEVFGVEVLGGWHLSRDENDEPVGGTVAEVDDDVAGRVVLVLKLEQHFVEENLLLGI